MVLRLRTFLTLQSALFFLRKCFPLNVRLKMITQWQAPDDSRWIVVEDSMGNVLSMVEEEIALPLIDLVIKATRLSVSSVAAAKQTDVVIDD